MVSDQADAQLRFRLERALLDIDSLGARRLVREACARRSSIEVVESVIVPVLSMVGQAWQEGTASLSQVYMSGRICEELVEAVVPMPPLDRNQRPRIAIATLEDYHLLGKRLVLSALRASGFAVRDLGRGDAREIASRALEQEVDILLLSTLMLFAALRVEQVRALLGRHQRKVQIVVGGAPFRFDPALAAEVGADASGRNTADAIAIVRRLTGRQP